MKYLELPEYILSHPWSADELKLISGKTKREVADIQVKKLKEMMHETFLKEGTFLVQRNQSVGINFFLEVGPIFSIEEGALHEIAHAIQIKKHRYKSLKSGLYYQKPKTSCNTVFGQTYYEPMTCEPTIMEAETVAIQLHLLELLNYKVDHKLFVEKWTDTLTNGGLPDFISHQQDAKAMVSNFIQAFYAAWGNRPYVMELRFKNFINYVKKNVLFDESLI